jgi:hypothetical protein
MTLNGRVSLAVLAGLAALAMATAPVDSARAQGACGMDWKPVCAGGSGWQRTFSNECWAKQGGAKVMYKGECKWGQAQAQAAPAKGKKKK